MEHDLYDFGLKRNIDSFDSYNVLVSIATNIPMLHFVVQGHIF